MTDDATGVTDNISYFDDTRRMLKQIAEDDRVEGALMAVVIVVSKDNEILSAIAYDDDEPRPFSMVGGLELVKARIMWKFMERIDG